MYILHQIYIVAKLLNFNQWNSCMKNQSLRAFWIFFQNCFLIFRSRITLFSYTLLDVKHPVDLWNFFDSFGSIHPSIGLSSRLMVHLSGYQSVCMSPCIHWFIVCSIHWSDCLSVHLSSLNPINICSIQNCVISPFIVIA